MIRTLSILLACACCAPGQELWIQVLRDGKPVADLQPGDLRIVEQTTHKEVTRLTRQSLPLDVMFIVEHRRWDPLDKNVRNAVMRITEGMKADETAGLLTASSEVKTVVPAGKSAPDFYRELGGLRGAHWIHSIGGPTQVSPNSNLLDATVVATHMLDSASSANRRRAIIILGQNLTGPESTTIQDAVRAAQKSGAIVTLLSLPEESNVDPQNRPPNQEWVLMRWPRRPPPPATGQMLDDLIRSTGGEVLIDAKAKQLRQVVDNLRTRYLLSYAADAPLGAVQAELTDKGRVAHSKATLHYARPLHPPIAVGDNR